MPLPEDPVAPPPPASLASDWIRQMMTVTVPVPLVREEVEFHDLARYYISPAGPQASDPTAIPFMETLAPVVVTCDALPHVTSMNDESSYDEYRGDHDEAEEDLLHRCTRCDVHVDSCACPRCPACDDYLGPDGRCVICSAPSAPVPPPPSSPSRPAADPYAHVNPTGTFDENKWTRRPNGLLRCRACGFNVNRPSDPCQCCPTCGRTPCRCCPACRRAPCVCLPLDQITPPPPEVTTYPARADSPDPYDLVARRDAREGQSSRPSFTSHPVTFFPPRGSDLPLGQRTPGPRRYTAVEIEVGGLAHPAQAWRVQKACEKWLCPVVQDASLPATGFEINTSPAKGKLFVEQVTELCKALRAAKAWVNIKCGLHVHVDSLDLSSAQILRLIEVYAKIEDGLFLVVPDSRRRNGQYRKDRREYCGKCARKLLNAIRQYKEKPDAYIYWGAPGDKGPKNRSKEKRRTRRLAHLAVYEGVGGKNVRQRGVSAEQGGSRTTTTGVLTGTRLQEALREHYAEAKYYALNLHSHFYTPGHLREAAVAGRGDRARRVYKYKRRGTIESRLAAGTTDPAKIIPWALLWDQVLYATTAWPTDRLNALSADPFEALLAVAETADLQAWLRDRREKFASHTAPPAEDF